jgi:transcriptional regulator with XRE-family HTH domain
LQARIRRGMATARLRGADLARACGVTPAAVSWWLSPRASTRTVPSPENLATLARVLGASHAWLAYGEGEPPEPVEGGGTRQGVVAYEPGEMGQAELPLAPGAKTWGLVDGLHEILLRESPECAGNVGRTVEPQSLKSVPPHLEHLPLDWEALGSGPRRAYDYLSPRLAMVAAPLDLAPGPAGTSHPREALLRLSLLGWSLLHGVAGRRHPQQDHLLVLVPRGSADPRRMPPQEVTALATLALEASAFGAWALAVEDAERLANIVLRVESGVRLPEALQQPG